jgi:hypothetical protein
MNVLEKLLDKEWEQKTPAELVDAPVEALEGVSKGDAELLKKAFGVKTIGDLGKNKYFLAAQTIVNLAALNK